MSQNNKTTGEQPHRGGSGADSPPYTTPRLVMYGNVADLTLGGKGSVAELQVMTSLIKHP